MNSLHSQNPSDLDSLHDEASGGAESPLDRGPGRGAPGGGGGARQLRRVPIQRSADIYFLVLNWEQNPLMQGRSSTGPMDAPSQSLAAMSMATAKQRRSGCQVCVN